MSTSMPVGTGMALPVGLVVEGESEVGAIPLLLRDSNIRLSRVVHFGGQPTDCPMSKFREFVERKIVPLVQATLLKQVSRVIVVVDRENRESCPGEFAQAVARTIIGTLTFRYQYAGSPPISVVCADRKLENWLIADPAGVTSRQVV